MFFDARHAREMCFASTCFRFQGICPKAATPVKGDNHADSTHIAVHRTAFNMAVELGLDSRRIDRTLGGRRSKLRTVNDTHRRSPFACDKRTDERLWQRRSPIRQFSPCGTSSRRLGYDAIRFRKLLEEMRIKPCIRTGKEGGKSFATPNPAECAIEL